MAAGSSSSSSSSASSEDAAVFVPDVASLPQRARSIAIKTCRPVYWHEEKLWLIDQRRLPGTFTVVPIETLAQTADAIRDMTVRGAPAIGAAGAYGVVLSAKAHVAAHPGCTASELAGVVEVAKRALDAARPTAVNLMWATARMLEVAVGLRAHGVSGARAAEALLEEAHEVCDEDVTVNKRMAETGAAVVPEKANILHHCNTGAIATVDIGTALGVIYECHMQGKGVHVWVDETRPRLQGARLTAWELLRAGVPMHLIPDSAAGILMLRKRVDIVLFGADRVASNGDVANKVGTYKVCVVARENGVPAYAVVPTSTIDLSVASGDDIPIEERSADEVTVLGGERIAPEHCPVYNPAFDVTPARYITGIITEEGICYPPFALSLKKAVDAAARRRDEARALRLARFASKPS